jgi:hypothetical protein
MCTSVHSLCCSIPVAVTLTTHNRDSTDMVGYVRGKPDEVVLQAEDVSYA